MLILNEVDPARAASGLPAVQALSNAQPRLRRGFLPALARPDLAGHDIRALASGRARPLWASTLIGNELTWYNPGMGDFERRALSSGRVDRGRVFRRLSFLFLHRPANPARRLGARSATQGGGPPPGGKGRLMPVLFHLHLHYLVLSLLAGVQIGPAAPSQEPVPAVARPVACAGIARRESFGHSPVPCERPWRR